MSLASGPLNLFLNSTYNNVSNSVAMTITGLASGHVNTFNNFPLYLTSDPLVSDLNLYIQGSDSGSISGALNLVLTGAGTYLSNGLSCFLTASPESLALYTLTQEQLDELTPEELSLLPLYQGIYTVNGFSCFTEGEGNNDGYYASYGSMNLYINGPSGVNNSIPLYIKGLPQQSIALYLHCVSGVLASGINLYINSAGIGNGLVNLFVRAYQDDNINQVTTFN